MADDPNTPPNPEPKHVPKEPETFSREYVTELRNENKAYRMKAAEHEKNAKDAAEATEQAKKDAAKLIEDSNQAANERIKRAELKAVAVKAGIVDLDGLKLADLSKVTINKETGEIEGADALIEQLKKDKPYLFGVTGTTSSTADKPTKPGQNTPKKVSEMTPEEHKAEAKRRGFDKA